MLIGNEQEKEQCMTYIKHSLLENRPIFLILIWPEGIGKRSFLQEYIKTLLWNSYYTDCFWMRDCTKLLGKPHSIQVETPATLKSIPIEDGAIYENKWVRETNTWLQQSSVSWKKILLIENIQRMTSSAMNAFLKACEEPLPWRYLFATAEHESWILPTILSRAMVIKFFPLSEEKMEEYVNTLSIEYPHEKKNLLIKMAMGKPWTFRFLAEKAKGDPELFDIIQWLIDNLSEKGNWSKKIQYLKKLQEENMFDEFWTTLIKDYTSIGNLDDVSSWLTVKKYMQANVLDENALWRGILSKEL